MIRGGYGRNFDKVLLNISSNERRSLLFQFASQTVLNPSYTNPLGGVTFEHIKSQNLPRNIVVIANDYKTPTQDQMSIGIAQQLGSRMSVQMDYVHTEGFNEPRARSINFFEDPVTHLPHPSEPQTAVRIRSTTRSRGTRRRRHRSTTACSLASRAGASARSGRARKCRAATRCRGPTATTRAIASTA